MRYLIHYFIFIITFGLSIIVSEVNAQELWTLEKCVAYAIEKSLQVEGSQYNLQSSEIDANLARHSRYPSLTGGSSLGWNFGRSIDPTSNTFITNTFFNNGFSLTSSVVLFNGNKINNTIEQSMTNNKASVKDLEQAKRDISLNVSTVYLNILFAKENVINAENQLILTNEGLSQVKNLIAVGNKPENDILDIEAQLAINEQAIVEAKNNLMLNLLNLKQLLRLDPDFELDIPAPKNIDFGTDPDLISFNEVYQSALNNQSSVRAGELRLKSAEFGERIAKAGLLPTFAVGGSARTNFSNKGLTVNGYENVTKYQNIIINNQEIEVGFPQSIPNLIQKPYFNQVSDNLSYGVTFTLSVPIYNNNLLRGGVERAKLATSRANLNYVQLKETLKITIGQAISDAKAAKAKYFATNKTQIAQTNLYKNAVKRFEIGNLSAFELTKLKTQMETSSVNTIIAKYNYIFRTKVIDFYLGKGISF